jgi:hypothetical protein
MRPAMIIEIEGDHMGMERWITEFLPFADFG